MRKQIAPRPHKRVLVERPRICVGAKHAIPPQIVPLFRAVWQTLPEVDQEIILRFWQRVAPDQDVRISIREGYVCGRPRFKYAAPGYLGDILLDELSMRAMPDDVLQYLIARELAHVLQTATGLDSSCERKALVERHAESICREWGWTPTSFKKWEKAIGRRLSLLTHFSAASDRVSSQNERPAHMSTLHQAAVEGNLEEMTKLLDGGADPNSHGTCGETPLHWAADCGDLKIVEFLIERGADVNAQAGEGSTPLHFAVEMNRTPVIELLLKHGAKPGIKSACGATVSNQRSPDGSDHWRVASLRTLWNTV